MKIYAIEWMIVNGINKYYIYTSKFLDQRKEIDHDFFENLRSTFKLADKRNSTSNSVYYEVSL